MRLTELTYAPSLQDAAHTHEYTYFGVTLDGTSTQVCGKHVHFLEPWTVLYHPAGEVHRNQFYERGAKEFNIEISHTHLQRLCEDFYFPDDGMLIHGGKAGWVAARLYNEFQLMDDLSWMAIEGLTIELMAEIVRHRVKPSSAKILPWLIQVQDLIRNRYSEPLTLANLARTVGVHPVHLAREFHRQVGCTIGQQIRQLRIEHACQMISKNNGSLVDIAIEVGFPDQSQFTKTFRKLVGVTPSEYRRLNCRANFRQKC
ncbi:MAG: AraC family transcriptional regulator [Acidobacteria bacterium]|nr:AraC family transcriptional regulator [Acidobacteriota bacterium]